MPDIDLSQRFPEMKPIKGPPSLTTINGCGVRVYGERDRDAETGTYVTTWCLCLLFVPVLCLRAYRVADARRGWLFLGREPLSALARGWNALLILGIIGGIGFAKYEAYTSSPSYKAQRKYDAAQSHVAAGHLTQAAQIYEDLIVSNTDQAEHATTGMKGLIDGQCAQAPLNESAGVYVAAAQVARRGNVLLPSEIADKGLKLAVAKGDTDPRSGILLLDGIRPLVVNTGPIDDRRFALLRKWAAAEPGDLEVITPLASIYEQKNQLDEAKKLLLPLKDRLGDGEGARVLGTILAREEKLDDAYALLWPYVKVRLERLHGAEQAAEDTGKQLWAREIKLLDQEKGPPAFYQRYKAASDDEHRNAIVREHVNAQIKDDPTYTSAQQALEREAAVVPVAIELGIVMLQRAQAQSIPDLRKTQLESVEKVFLAIGGVAGESDVYRISLGQVYYWLGKQAEGRALFNDYLTSKGRAFPDLIQIALKLRQLGANAEARTMIEEAYNKTSKPEEQHGAAQFRSVLHKDSDDEIAWLNKANTADPIIKATLAKALGHKAFEEGRDDEAVRQFQACIDANAAMPRSSTTLNETALAQYSIFLANGDHGALERCIDYFQQAVALDPSNTILLYNAGSTLLEGAIAEIIGSDIDLHALHQPGQMGLLRYLYIDQPGRDALAKRLKGHPGMVRGLGYLEKAMVLSPKFGDVYAVIFSVHRFTHNDAAATALEQRLRAAELDPSDHLTQMKEFISGLKDQQNKVTISAALNRIEARNVGLRAKGGRTAAVGLDQQADAMMSLDTYTGTVDPEKVLSLAKEANALAPSSATRSGLIGAYFFKVAKDLSAADPAFDAFFKKYMRSLGISYLMATLVSEPGPFQQKILQHPQMKSVIELVRAQSYAFPENESPYEWAILKNADAEAAERAAQSIRKSPRQLLHVSIDALLSPASGSEAMETYWLMQILGKPEQGAAAVRKVIDMGIPLPVKP